MKYNSYARWFIARCYEVQMDYDHFAPIAKLLLGLDVPKGTYDSQKAYLKHRTPEDMGNNGPTSIGAL